MECVWALFQIQITRELEDADTELSDDQSPSTQKGTRQAPNHKQNS
jgi:hypothetical protein